MPKKAPLDIQFLLESLTSEGPKPLMENPDGVRLVDGDKWGSSSWRDKDAYAFFCFKDYSIIAAQESHNGTLYYIIGFFDDYKDDMEHVDSGLDTLETFYEIYVSDRKAFALDLFTRNGILNRIVSERSRGSTDVSYRSGIPDLLVGRAWVDKKWMSFWDSQTDVIKKWSSVEKMFAHFNGGKGGLGDLNDYQVDWLEREDIADPLASVSSFSSAKKSSTSDDSAKLGDIVNKIVNEPVLLDKLSDDKLKAIVGKLHTMDPEVKAQVMKANPAALKNKAAEIAGKLGMSVAEFRSLWSMDEGMLKEDPDKVSWYPPGSHGNANKVSWSEEDAYTFFSFDKYALIGLVGGDFTHTDILISVKRLLGMRGGKWIALGVMNREEILVTNQQEFLKDLFSEPKGALGTFLTNNTIGRSDAQANGSISSQTTQRSNSYGSTPTRGSDSDAFSGSRSDIKRCIVGRLWADNKVMAFWTEQVGVISGWDQIEDMFKHFPRAGNLKDYSIDWVERDPEKVPLTPAKLVSKSGIEKKPKYFNPMILVNKIAREPELLDRLSSDQLKRIREKLHVLPPDMKAAVMKNSGHELVNKSAEIADKLGMSVAEFRSLWSMDEGKLNESPDIVYDRDKNYYWKQSGTYAFYCTSEYGIVGKGAMHGNLIGQIVRFVQHNGSRDITELNAYKIFVSDENKFFDDIYGTGPIGKYIKGRISGKIDNFDANAYRNIADVLVGRIWTEQKVMSFWNKIDVIVPLWTGMEKMFDGLSSTFGELDSYSIDWLGRDGEKPMESAIKLSNTSSPDRPKSEAAKVQKLFDAIFNRPQLIDNLSEPSKDSLINKLHVMEPELKAQVMKMNSAAIKNKSTEIADKLGMSVAEFHSIWRMDEEVLKENPDRVRTLSPDGKWEESGWWDKGAFTFLTTKHCGVGRFGETHGYITKRIKRSFMDKDTDLDDFKDYEGIQVFGESELKDELFYNVAGPFNELVMDDKDERDDSIGGLIVGRLWTNSKKMSFWNSQAVVIKNWDAVESMFDGFGKKIGNLEEYSIDWLERKNDERVSLTPVSSIKKSGTQSTSEKVVAILNSKDVVEKLSDEKLLALLGVVHVLPPAEKARVMKGTGNILINKSAEIADKLGMSVAQFRSLWSMDEDVIKEDPDRPSVTVHQLGAFKKKGINVSNLKSAIEDGVGLYYDSDNAVSFMMDTKNKITIYNTPSDEDNRLTHPDLLPILMSYISNPDDFKVLRSGKYAGIQTVPTDDFEPPPGYDYGSVSILQAKSTEEFDKLATIVTEDAPVEGDISRGDKQYIQGRIWLDQNIVSFWSTKNATMKHFDMLNQFFVGMRKSKEKVLYEFIDSKHIYTHDELSGGAVLTRSKEEVMDLMRKQHLDPAAKKKLAALFGGPKQKVSPGWDFQAQRDAAMPALQEKRQ
jgi:hypothetical protein